MSRNDENSIELVKYPILNRFHEILHFTTTRIGGVSTGNYASFNLGLYSGDKKENIDANFALLCEKTGIQRDQIHLPFQTHENHCLTIDEKFLSENSSVQSEKLKGIDALITNLPNQFIGVSTADCVPVFLYDPVRKVVAVAHAGWRGTCSRIVAKTILSMQQNFHSNPSDIIAVIGPSISPDVYEVGEELPEIFRKEDFGVEEIFFKKNGRNHLDLWKANKMILVDNGVLPENIGISGLCTFTENERFFSARRLGIQSGRMVSGMMILKSDV